MISNSLRSHARSSPVLSPSVAALIGCCLAVSPAAAQKEELLKGIPPGANAIALINAESLLNSEMSVRGGWKDKRDLHYGERPLMIPTEAQTVVIGAQLNPAEEMARVWEVAMMDLSIEFPIAAIARTDGRLRRSDPGSPGRLDPDQCLHRAV